MLTPAETAAKYLDIGSNKTQMPFLKLLTLSFFGGAFIALAAMSANVISAAVSSPGVGKILGAAVFPLGLTLIVLSGAELFTGNCLIAVCVLDKKTSFLKMLRNWGIVYLGNLIGSVVIAVLACFSDQLGLFGGAVLEKTVSVAAAKMSLPFFEAFCSGILCNILVCVAVWLAVASKSAASKAVAVYLPVFAFVLCGLEHSVANMYYIPAGLIASGDLTFASVGGMLMTNLLPVTLGNIVGGSLITGGLLWLSLLRGTKKNG